MCETFGILDLHGCMIIPCILDISISIACRLAFDYLACHLNNARFIPLNTPLKKVRGLWSVEIFFLFLSFCWVITQSPVKWFSVFLSSWSPWYCISNPIKCWNFFFLSILVIKDVGYIGPSTIVLFHMLGNTIILRMLKKKKKKKPVMVKLAIWILRLVDHYIVCFCLSW